MKSLFPNVLRNGDRLVFFLFPARMLHPVVGAGPRGVFDHLF
ncbi:hypothetical protein V473_22300 [Sphingobium cupriresistens LL01]|uniref:Uncharacterized protein n=1 Tax=Sphingobium cupriresistens LL01 TaxID=1420583 RepID=A0A0J7XJL5_9SPHN|nr:hypothetical protein V473_22300 [Sphingobium cupriresistens LL01]